MPHYLTSTVNLCKYSTEVRIEHAGALFRESRPHEIALALLHARRFPRNLVFTNHLGTVLLEVLAQNFRTHVLTLVVHVSEGTARVGGGPLVAHGRQEGVVPPHLRPRVVEPGAGEGRTRPAAAFSCGWNQQKLMKNILIYL